MKKKIILGLILILVFSMSILCYATTENVTVGENETDTTSTKTSTEQEDKEMVDNDYFDANENLDISSKTFAGNVFVAAQTIEISNVDVKGSLYVAGMNVNIDNVNVSGSIYVGGQNVNVNDTKSINIYLGASEAKLNKGVTVEKDIYAYAKDLDFEAETNYANIGCDNLKIGEDTVVHSKMEVSTDDEPKIPDDANIKDYELHLEEVKDNNQKEAFSISNYIENVVKYAIIVVMLALLLSYITPNFIENIKSYDTNQIIKSFGIGILASIVIPIFAIILCITVIGIRFFVALSLLYIIGLMFATPITCILISLLLTQKLNKDEKKYFYLSTIGVALVFGIIKQIPVLSIISELGFGFVGFGIIVKALLPSKKTE